MLGFLIFFREGQYVGAEQAAAIGGGILLIVAGCGLIGSRWTPVPMLHCWVRLRKNAPVSADGGDVRVRGGGGAV